MTEAELFRESGIAAHVQRGAGNKIDALDVAAADEVRLLARVDRGADHQHQAVIDLPLEQVAVGELESAGDEAEHSRKKSFHGCTSVSSQVEPTARGSPVLP